MYIYRRSPIETKIAFFSLKTGRNSEPYMPIASVVRDDGLIQLLRASEAMYRNSENMMIRSKVRREILCKVTSQKGKGIIPSPEVNDQCTSDADLE